MFCQTADATRRAAVGFGGWGRAAASKRSPPLGWLLWGSESTGRGAERVSAPRSRRLRAELAARVLGLDDLVEHELAVVDRVSAVVGDRCVTVGVDGVRPEDRRAVLDVVEPLDHVLAAVALVASVLDRLEGRVHGLIAIDRVRLGVAAVLGLEVAEELLSGRRVQLLRQGRVGDERVLL